MIRYSITADAGGRFSESVVEGVPEGIEIPPGYLDHQIHRFRTWIDRKYPPASDRVAIVSGLPLGRTDGSPVVLRLERNIAGLAPPSADDQNRRSSIRIAGCTVIRKVLEDLGVFTGSHVLRIGTAAVKDRSRIDRLIRAHVRRASCAAYKVTEEADKFPFRILDRPTGSRAARRRAHEGEFELLVTGFPEWLLADEHQFARVKGGLAQALLSEPGISGIDVWVGFQPRGVAPRFARKPRLGTIILTVAAHKAAAVGPGVHAAPEGRGIVGKSVLCEALVQPVLAAVVLESLGTGSISALHELLARHVTDRMNAQGGPT